jgi:CelD/BcsL family acetyltransferase involved in cellulose biosynthesis
MSDAGGGAAAGIDIVEQPLRLNFRIGDWRIAQARVAAAFQTTHVSALPDDPAAAIASADALPARISVLVLPSHPVPAGWRRLFRTPTAIVYSPSLHAHSLVDLAESIDAYMAARPRKHRHEITRKLKRFAALTGDDATIEVCSTPDAIDRFFDAVAPLAAATYQSRLLQAGLPLDAAFRAECRTAAAADRIRGFLLRARGAAIAFGFCRVHGDRVDYVHTGYAASARDLAPGYVLLHAMIEWLIGERRFALLDLGYGDAQYKRCFATRSLDCATIQIWRRGPRAALLIGAHRACDAVSNRLAALLDRLGVKPALKRLLRG